ncbi:protein RER1C-like isoform X2 [Actinidia eriantha]|uniref:protein RER1C-like isoform X2 n=1 Tax=Actinidia eriantha TaxID=165200 RepID=UPI00258D397F|nr:protein RER1C-like isoform X2 [Actinidia eriantha]
MDAGGAKADLSSNSPASAASRWSSAVSQRFQHLLDKSTPFVLQRWIAFAAVAIVYVIRVWFAEGFYIVSYALGIYILNLLIGFLSPQVDPEFQDLSDGPTLPTLSSDEFRPFVRRVPEFKFWNYFLLKQTGRMCFNVCVQIELLICASAGVCNVLNHKSLLHCFCDDILQHI